MTLNNQNSLPPAVRLNHIEPSNRSNSVLQSVRDRLEAANIICAPEPQSGNLIALLLIIEESTVPQKILDYLEEILVTGLHVIILYDSDHVLPFYKVWQFLSAGVDDVLNIRGKIQYEQVVKAKMQRWKTINRFLASEKISRELIGSSLVWKKVLRQILEIASFSTLPVLILGESGTGKELIARLIHEFDKRPDKQDIILLDCTTIVSELSGSEFFGHEKGAFTNAISTRDGAFALADRGTLFLDEIGELPLRLQAELLRVIQEGIYKRVGSNMWKKTKFRLVSATHRHLLEEVQRGNFRQDLYYRICTCVVKLPPLRERRLDIPELAEHFLRQELKTSTTPVFSPALLNYLMSQDFPGNVRELKQLIARLAFRYCGDGPIRLGHIPSFDRDQEVYTPTAWKEKEFNQAIRKAMGDGVGLKDIKRIAGDIAMKIAIEQAGGNLQDAARRLGVSDRLVQGYLSSKRNQ